MNGTQNNTTEPESGAFIEIRPIPIALLFIMAGTIFCSANIFLVIYFTRKKHFTKTTHIFLCNLGVSGLNHASFAFLLLLLLLYLLLLLLLLLIFIYFFSFLYYFFFFLGGGVVFSHLFFPHLLFGQAS